MKKLTTCALKQLQACCVGSLLLRPELTAKYGNTCRIVPKAAKQLCFVIVRKATNALPWLNSNTLASRSLISTGGHVDYLEHKTKQKNVPRCNDERNSNGKLGSIYNTIHIPSAYVSNEKESAVSISDCRRQCFQGSMTAAVSGEVEASKLGRLWYRLSCKLDSRQPPGRALPRAASSPRAPCALAKSVTTLFRHLALS